MAESKEICTKLSDEEWEKLEKRYSKEIEALKRIKNKFIDFFHEDVPDFDVLEQALTELQQIKSAEPTKALECLKRISIKCHPKSDGHTLIDDDLETIKQALMSKSNAERCWEICKEKKHIDVKWLKGSRDFKEYNAKMLDLYSLEDMLTEEEFNLLKREVGK